MRCSHQQFLISMFSDWSVIFVDKSMKAHSTEFYPEIPWNTCSSFNNFFHQFFTISFCTLVLHGVVYMNSEILPNAGSYFNLMLLSQHPCSLLLIINCCFALKHLREDIFTLSIWLSFELVSKCFLEGNRFLKVFILGAENYTK